MAGTRGPIGIRSDLLRGHGAEKSKKIAKVSAENAKPLVWHDPDPVWTEANVRLYRSLAESAMARFYQQSDAELAYSVISVLDTALKTPSRTSGLVNQSAVTACWIALGNLGISEGSRRRLGIEVAELPDEHAGAKLAILADYKKLREESEMA
jgi:hypothetical protein